MKRLLLFMMVLGMFSLFASEYDREMVVLGQSRNDKVKTVFQEMMNRYEEEDLNAFFSFVSEDRFHQDYMTFHEAIEEDFRVYDILNVDTWIDKITTDGVKRYLYVKWDKRYESTNSDTEINRLGYSRFLFDEINGEYKLIEIAGNNFWGGSLPEWREEVIHIAGEEPEKPDLTVTITSCPDGGPIVFEIKNLGVKTTLGEIEYRVTDTQSGGSINSYIYDGDISMNESVRLSQSTHNCRSGKGDVTVDQNNLIDESNEDNNIDSL